MARKLIGLVAIALFALGTTAYAGIPPSSTCKDKKAKATGKKALGLLKAFGANAKVTNLGKLASDISKAQSKFSKGFTKAEFSGSGASKGCTTIEDADDIETKTDAFVLDVFGDLTPTTTTTMAATTTTTTTTLPPGPELLGALTPTIGNFTYNLSTGLPGANAACNTNFPGTHACEYSELLIAEALGELVGLQDTAATPVTSFWVIDNSNNADLAQCNEDSATPGVPVPGANWEYGTAHTPSRGRRVDLNNGTGDLSAIGPLQQCNAFNRWVGCCL